eukprot:5991794-Lingulodinium_polyedra.AAC.1
MVQPLQPLPVTWPPLSATHPAAHACAWFLWHVTPAARGYQIMCASSSTSGARSTEGTLASSHHARSLHQRCYLHETAPPAIFACSTSVAANAPARDAR